MNGEFHEVGFLASNASSWIAEAEKQFPDDFALADRMNRTAMRMLYSMPEGDQPLEQVMAWASFCKALQAFQTSLVLARLGAIAEGRALGRLCTESVILTAALAEFPEETAAKLDEDNFKHRLGLANVVLEMGSEALPEQIMEAIDEKRAILATYPKPRQLNYAALAKQVGMDQLYILAYKFPSGDGAHATWTAIGRHHRNDENGPSGQLVYEPTLNGLRKVLLCANASLVQLLATASAKMGVPEFKDECERHNVDWYATRENLVVRANFPTNG